MAVYMYPRWCTEIPFHSRKRISLPNFDALVTTLPKTLVNLGWASIQTDGDYALNCTKLFVVFSILLMVLPRVFSQQASVSPSALNFAPQVVNFVSPGSHRQTATLTNTGNADLVIRSVQASGGYKQTNDCSTLLPNQSCNIEVTFDPGTLGSINGTITITDNTPPSPQIVSLSGKGIAPAQLSPSRVSFGAIAVGSTSQPQALKLMATPNSNFSINQISVSGNFAQTNNCPLSLQGGQSCTINVVFHPTVNALVAGAVAVSTTVESVPLAFSVPLKGTGSGNVVSRVSVQPASLNFGNKGPDFVDSVKELTLTNTSGNTSLSIQSVSLSGSPNAVGAMPLYKINSNSCSGLLAPGAQCKIAIAFSTMFSRLFPQSYSGALTITDSDSTNPQVIGIFGNQVEELTFSPASMVFPPQPVGTTTTKTVTVTGNDTQPGLVLDIATSGDFAETGDLGPCFLKPGAKCTMTVSFTPRQTGVINGSVTIETYPECNPFPLHECSDPIVLNLSGTGQ